MSFKRPLSLLTVLLFLSGCAVETCRDHACSPDQKLVEAVEANIRQHPALLGDHLRVQADHGVVYLYGLVASNVELVDVEEVAKATPGVSKVVNMCTIENVLR